jgi:hypothetical protein
MSTRRSYPSNDTNEELEKEFLEAISYDEMIDDRMSMSQCAAPGGCTVYEKI